ncbi:DUF861 domain-containing protein [Kordia sp. YSTF-M3]|uniref:DUF861 domain-containing protein n=1 Tax=Kordia aestuariivivens TaxID=2759037 RepID=A0ABR7Q5H1_9FLAO|nr:cupin domain-containing protein [Kordia aestuariivivens]MBC8753772.1 DUF861 domain-containing protein [Kordia aestuariivivens]
MQFAIAQDISKDTVIKPFEINKRFLSGINIPKVKLKAHPERAYFQRTIYKGSDLSVFILSSETATNTIKDFSVDEFVYYLKGKAEIKLENNEKRSFLSGDYICVPKGFSGEWTNNEGNKYHLELSVISNKRADKEAVSIPSIPFLLDREVLSGIKNETTLFSGVELNIEIVSEIPGHKEISPTTKDQFIHVLDGMIVISANNDSLEIFHRGDFFVLPKGFSGILKTEAQDTCRMLVVTAK